MRKWIFLLLASFHFSLTVAQYAGYNAVADPSDFRSAFAAASKKLLALRTDFIQEKNISLLADKIVSRGKFWFRRENQVRMEYQQPYQYLIIINHNNVTIRDGGKDTHVSAKSNKLFQQINNIMLNCFNGSVLESADFTLRLFENKTGYLAELTPKASSLHEIFSNILLQVDRKNMLASAITLNEAGGDNTVIRFTNPEINPTLPDALFDHP